MWQLRGISGAGSSCRGQGRREDEEHDFCGGNRYRGRAISFLIPSGAFLTGAQAVIADLTTSGSGTAEVFARSFADLDRLGVVGAGSFDILTGRPLTGTRNYQFLSELHDGAVGDTISFDWRIELTVGQETAQVIPLPAGLPLMLGAFAAFGVLGWRRRGT